MPNVMIALIAYINLLNLSWIKKMSIFEEYGVFNHLMSEKVVSVNLTINVFLNTRCL